MARTVKELLDERNGLVVKAKALNDSVTGRAMTKEEDAQFSTINADIDRLKAEADRAARFEAIDAEVRPGSTKPGREDVKPGHEGRGEITDETRSAAIAGWFAEQSGAGASDAEVEAAKACRLNLRARELTIPVLRTGGFRKAQRASREVFGSERDATLAAVECRDLSVGSNVAGGYISAPEEMVRSLELAMLAYGGIYEQADVIRTANGNPLSWPSADDTGNSGEWLAEAQTIGTTSVDPTFGKTTWMAHKVSSKPVKVSYELLRDSIFDLPGTLGAMLGERIGRAKATAFATGSGAGKPLGLTLSTTLGVTAAGTSSITTDELLDLIHSIDLAYRKAGCAFVMKDSAVLHLRKKKDGDGQYIWRAGLEAGQPDTLFGYPVVTSQEMPAIATGVKAVVFGSLKAYKVREVGAIRLRRFAELYGETDQEGFVAFHEADGGLLDAGTHPVKHLLMA